MTQSFPLIKTENLILRQLDYRDAKDVHRLFSDPLTMKFDGGETMNSLIESFRFIDTYSTLTNQTKEIRWAIVLRKTNTFCGTAGFHSWDHHAQKAEIGGEILKDFWQNGIASETLDNLISFGFSQLKLNRLSALVNPNNKGAIALLKKSPFKKEGLIRECQKWDGTFVDLEIFGILKREWDKTVNFSLEFS